MNKTSSGHNDRLRMKLRLLLLCVLTIAVGLTLSALAAQAESAAAEVVVSATRTEQEVFEVASSAAVVNAKTLEREPHTTIAEALQDIPGVQVADGGMGGGVKRVSIRGESGSQVLILVDGMKISEQKFMDGSMVLISPANIERIEVIKGPASVLYGSEAIGGVVNIITRKGTPLPTTTCTAPCAA